MNYNAVVFDMDGVIFDSERAVLNTWIEISNKYNISITEDIYRKTIGVTGEVRDQTLLSIYGQDFPINEFIGEFQTLYNKKYANGNLPVKNGVYEILEYLKSKNIKIALASLTYKDRVFRQLKNADIFKYFDIIITGDMVTHGKPHPEIYLTACNLLNTDPKDTISIEDSYSGLQSAFTAGLYTIMVPDMLEPTEESKKMTKRIFYSLNEVKDYLSNI